MSTPRTITPTKRRREVDEQVVVAPRNLLTTFEETAMPGRDQTALPEHLVRSWGTCFRCGMEGHFKSNCPFDTRIFSAKYAGTCRGCGKNFQVGTKLVRSEVLGGFSHPRCALGAEAVRQTDERQRVIDQEPPHEEEEEDSTKIGARAVMRYALREEIETPLIKVLAAPGSGKTKLLVDLYKAVVPGRGICLVFNKAAQMELLKRGVKEDDGYTFHAFGYRAYKRWLADGTTEVKIVTGKTKKVMKAVFGDTSDEVDKLGGFVDHLVRLGKSFCVKLAVTRKLEHLADLFDLRFKHLRKPATCMSPAAVMRLKKKHLKDDAGDVVENDWKLLTLLSRPGHDGERERMQVLGWIGIVVAMKIFDISLVCALGGREWPFSGPAPEVDDEIWRRLKLQDSKVLIDFADMLYVPLAVGAQFLESPKPQKLWLLVDEAQDTDTARREVIVRVLGEAPSRLVAVGDEMQAIYGFAGADPDALKRPPFDSAVIFTLPTCWRCPRSHVKLANTLLDRAAVMDGVPPYDGVQIRPRSAAAEGAIHRKATFMSFPLPGDRIARGRGALSSESSSIAILCRTNAPLLALRWILLGRGMRCDLLGRKDLGTKLRSFVDQLVDNHDDLAALKDALNSYVRRRSSFGFDLDDDPVEVLDMCNCLRVVLNFLDSDATLADFLRALSEMFADDLEGITPDQRQNLITLATGHKAKGLQWDRVYILEPWQFNFFASKPYAPRCQARQELNVEFVCATRAKIDLIFLKDCNEDYASTNWRDSISRGLFGNADPEDPLRPPPTDEEQNPDPADEDWSEHWRGFCYGEQEKPQRPSNTQEEDNNDSEEFTSVAAAAAELGIDDTTSPPDRSTVRKAYKRRMLEVHPDKQAARGTDALDAETAKRLSRLARAALDFFETYFETSS